jgi:hypothetical protein
MERAIHAISFTRPDQQDDMRSQSQVSERAETLETNPLADMVFVAGRRLSYGLGRPLS